MIARTKKSSTPFPYNLFSLVTAVALAAGLLFVSSPASATSNSDVLSELTPTADTTTTVQTFSEATEEDNIHEYVPSRLQETQEAEEEKEISSVSLSFSGSAYGAAVMSYITDTRDLESRRHGTSLVVDGVSEQDIEYLEKVASHLGTFEGVELFYKDEVSIAGVLSPPTSNDPYPNTLEYDAIDLGDLWSDIDNPNAEIVVAVLDTGVTEVAELSGRVLPGYDFTDEGDSDWSDTNGHGTFVASQIAGHFNNETGSYGVCQQCKILPVQVLGGNGTGSFDWISAGIRWAADNGADIISMSLSGKSSSSTLLSQDIAYAKSKGAILVAAAGNNNINFNSPGSDSFYPAAAAGVVSVAASEPDGSGSFPRAGFSNYGNLNGVVDIAAPGCVDAAGLNGDEWKCGTSMATPIVSSVIGLMLAQFPDLTASEITYRLFGFASANPLNYTISGHLEGTSLLDETILTPTPLTAPDFGVTVSGAWECTAVEVGQLPVTLENTGTVDASVEIVFAGFWWDETTTYDTVLVPAGQTVSLAIDRSVFPGYITEFYMYEAGATDFLIWDYIPDHNDCAGFTVDHLDLAPHLCHMVPGQEELGIQRSTFVEYITSGNVHRIWIQSKYSRPGYGAGVSFGGANSQGELWEVDGVSWEHLLDSGTITLSITPWFTEPFYSKTDKTYLSSAFEVDVTFDNPCDESYLPVQTTIDSTVDWSTSALSGPFREDVEVSFALPANMEVETLSLSGTYLFDSYDRPDYQRENFYRPLSSDGTTRNFVSHYANHYGTTDDFSSVTAYLYRYRLNDGIAKSEWLESTVQFSVSEELSVIPEFLPYCANSSDVSVNWYVPPTALPGTQIDFQVTTGSGTVSPNGWALLNEEWRFSGSDPWNAQPVSNCVPDPDVIGEDVFVHILRTETATTADGEFMGGEPQMFTFQVPAGIRGDDAITGDPNTGNPHEGKADLVDGSRLTDTRNPEGYGLPGGVVRYIQVSGLKDIPSDAKAATVNFTVAGAAGWGFLTAWSCDSSNSSVPDSSILNYNAGWVRANTQTIGLGNNGGICVWSYTDIDLIVDTQGYLNSSAIQMYTEPPRIADDRGANGRGDYNAGEVRRIEVASDAVAAFVNLTVVDAKQWGFLTAWPCASAYDSPPNASAANYDAGQTVANNALVALNNGGFCIYSYGETGVLVDLMGIIDGNETSIVPLGSQRLADTRAGASTIDGVHAGGGRLEANQTRAFQITGRGDVPSSTLDSYGNPVGLAGVYLNVTSVNPEGTGGFLTVWACDHAGEKVPNTSALNYNETWSATPNSIVQKVSESGRICVYAHQATDVIIDVTGYVK